MEEWKEGKSGATGTAATGAKATVSGDAKSSSGRMARANLVIVFMALVLTFLLFQSVL
jgi:hypothetical protein